MTIAGSNFTTLAYQEETTEGAYPTSGTFRYLPYTGESLQYTKDSISSNNINSTRQVSDLIQTGFQVSGGIDFELAPMLLDEFIEGAVWSDWGSIVDAEYTVTFADADPDTITDDGTGSDFTAFVAGQFVQVVGSVSNDGIYEVASATGDVITLETNASLTAEVSTAGVTIRGCMIRNGVVRHSYVVEKCLTDTANDTMFSYRGCLVNSLSVSAQSSAIITGSLDLTGRDSLVYETGTESTAAIDASVSTGILNAVAHLTNVYIDGVVPTGVYFQGLDFTITNNMRGVQAIGTAGNVDVLPGQLEVTGSLNAYFVDKTMYEYFLNDSEKRITYFVEDTTTKEGFAFTFPRVVFSTADMSAGGNDQDMVLNMSFQSLLSSSTANSPNSSIQIDRFLADYTAAPDQ
jgi:hypothetical protein